MTNTYKIYGKTIRTWTEYDEKYGCERICQREIEYKEFYKDTHELKQTGSKDFTRYTYPEMTTKEVWVWDGERRNAGNKRWFSFEGNVSFSSGDAKSVKEYMGKKYGAVEVQLR